MNSLDVFWGSNNRIFAGKRPFDKEIGNDLSKSACMSESRLFIARIGDYDRERDDSCLEKSSRSIFLPIGIFVLFRTILKGSECEVGCKPDLR